MQVERVNISIDIGFTLYSYGKGKPCITLITGFTDRDACGVLLLKKLVEELKDKTLHGSVVIIPQINENGLKQSSCKKQGRSRTFCKIIEKLSQVIPNDCYVIEIRCRQGFVEHIVAPQDFIVNEKNFVEAIPINYVVKAKIRGALNLLIDKGFKVLSIIINGGKVFDVNYVQQFLEKLLIMLSNLSILKKKSKQVDHSHVYFDGYYKIRCSNRGIFVPEIPSGVEVDAGAAIGTLEDDKVIANQSGLALYVSKPKLCDVDEVVAVIAVKKEDQTSTHQ